MRRSYLLLPLLFVLFASPVSATDEPITLLIVDKSEPGSPLEVSGKLLLGETIEGKNVWASWQQHIVAKNISEKPILLLVEEIGVTGYRDVMQFRCRIDNYFFAEHGTDPQGWVEMPEGSPSFPLTSLDAPHEPRGEFRVVFVQFDDGSTFGNSAEGKNYIENRQAILAILRNLAETYSLHGEQAFQAQLEQQGRSPDDPHLLQFQFMRKTAKDKGIDAAIERVRGMIALAEAHETAFRLNGRE